MRCIRFWGFGDLFGELFSVPHTVPHLPTPAAVPGAVLNLLGNFVAPFLRTHQSLLRTRSSIQAAKLFVGQRVADKDGSRGTVQYLGPVATSKSADVVYAGV